MNRRTACLAACMAAILPAAAGFAQPQVAHGGSRAGYCQQLIRLYRTYVFDPNDTHPRRQSANAADETAIAKCHAGDASGVAQLERALRDARVGLPPRS